MSTELERGMRAQLDSMHEAFVHGMPRVGWKIGINDPRMMERFGIHRPVVGWLAGDRVLRSGDRFVPPPHARIAVEAEVAIHVGGGGAVVGLAPALEIINFSRPANSFEEVVAHDIFHEGLVLGREVLPVPIVDDTWPCVRRNGEEVGCREPSLLVLQPAAAVRHVADLLARFRERLESGDWIIAGTLARPVLAVSADRIEVDFGPLGHVAVEIA